MATLSERLTGAVKQVLDRDAMKAPPDVQDRLKRGRARRDEGSAYSDESIAMWRGEQYSYVSGERYLVKESTVTNQDGTGKPKHRVRRVFNLIQPVIARKVSQATSRVPGYEINASTADPEDASAARLSGKVARYGYDQWHVREATEKVATYALVADEGFAWPFFDTSIGPYVGDDEGVIGIGDVRIRIYGRNEVMWEPGVDFFESRWIAVEQARPLYEVYELPGYVGGELTPDATTNTNSLSGSAERQRGGQNAKLVLVTDYLERPSPKYPRGRWVTIANNRVICGYDGDETYRDYPLCDHDGNVADEPVLHKLWFITDPASDRDMGLVRFLADPNRIFNNAASKQIEWMQTALNPQVIVKNGRLRQKLNDVPGAVFDFRGPGDVTWRPVPNVPPELSTIKSETREILQFIASDQGVPAGLESAKSIATFIEREDEVWKAFYARLAEFHSRLMRHCLWLVQRNYTEPRLLKVRGTFGVESIPDFLGAKLRGQADVTVLPGSIEPRTRQQIEAKVMAYAEKGWISKERAMAAIDGGFVEEFERNYELDIARAHRIVRRIQAGEAELLGEKSMVVVGLQPRQLPDGSPNEAAGQPILAPGWMPRKSDNLGVFKGVFEDFFKTADYEALDVTMQKAAHQVYAKLLQLEAEAQAEAAAAQTARAEQQGLQNAAADQGQPKPLPDTPASGGEPFPPPEPPAGPTQLPESP